MHHRIFLPAMKHLHLALFLAAWAALPGPAEQATQGTGADAVAAVIDAGNLAVRLTADGRVTGAAFGKPRLERALTAETILAGCRRDGATIMRKLADGTWTFQSRWVQPATPNACVLVERFSPTPNSVRWEVDIHGDGKPWTATLATVLRWPEPSSANLWMAWQDPINDNINKDKSDHV